MQVQQLAQNWTMQIVGQETSFTTDLPSSVYQVLLDNQQMDDPFWRDNEDKALALMDKDFVYTTTFTTDLAMLASDQLLLRFHGLDTVAEIALNGQKLGTSNNQHRIWEYDVTDMIIDGENQLVVYFHSPTQYIKQMQEKKIVDGSSDAMIGFPHIRKAHCMFGWDWGPRLPDVGIWRPVELLGIQHAWLTDVYVTQEHTEDYVALKLSVCSAQLDDQAVHYEVTVTAPDGTVLQDLDSPTALIIDKPQLWWPNGYGAQPLYQVNVTLKSDGEIVDVWEKRIGLRTMTMQCVKDEYGESFAHQVNGVPIFGMGADYIPEDNIFSRINPARTKKLLKQCVMANFNAVRVWGGGYYPDDWFYDTCDELGLLVWQDFMFACATYDLNDDFEETVTRELIDNIKRLRHHASLGLWCGNNEMELFVDQGMWVSEPKHKADYIKMYEYIFPKLLKQYDPQTFYWPASPSSGGAFDAPNDPNRGDVHYWDVWHGGKPFSEYRKFFFRYASEFGFQSFPCEKTVESFTLPEDRNVFSYVMEKHQRNDAANGKIMTYLYQTYRYPTDFGTLLYTSQLLQAEAIKYGVEHFRRHRGRCMGAIYWQLNDCWPVASWASIDYYGRWKALHYYAKRFFAPVMLSCQEEGTMTQQTNVNGENQNIEKSITLNVANETFKTQTVLVKWALHQNDGSVLQSGEQVVSVAALTSRWLDKICFPDADIHTQYASYEMLKDGEQVASGSVLFCAPKHFEFIDPQVTVTVNGDTLIVSTDGYAKGVELLNENQDWVLEDNYFDLSQETRTIKVLEGNIDTITIRTTYDIR